METRECDCCGLDKDIEDGQGVYNKRDEYDTWICVDCLNEMPEYYS